MCIGVRNNNPTFYQMQKSTTKGSGSKSTTYYHRTSRGKHQEYSTGQG